MTLKKKYNSINDSSRVAMINNQNALEIITKLDQALNSTENYISLKTVDSSGNEVISQLPTIGFFQQKLEQITKMVKTLAGIEGSNTSLQIANNTFKRIITSDLNGEPKPVPQIPTISTFKADPNWIFDSFLNPKISVELDLTGKISDNTKLIKSKRFIVEFDKILSYDENNNPITEFTEDAKLRIDEFNTKYKGQSNINIVEFITWLDSPGLVNNNNDYLIDEDTFRIEPVRLQNKGNFTVLSTDIDTINKKLWYILDTLTYYDISNTALNPKPVDLKIGDLISVNPNDAGGSSATVYKVVEISTITSEYRVRFERVFGEEPIPVRLNAISIYSNTVKTRNVKISVGFDEYCVLFVKQLDDINNIEGIDWSPGIGFYTNELRLNNESGELFSDFYINKVLDYGLVLEDLVEKKIPNYYAKKPNAPVLDTTNFKVVQINAHLTQTVEAETIRDLHNQKNNIASQITQIQSSIEKQNRLISTTKFTAATDKKRAQDELVMLNSKLDSKNKTKATIVAEILANTKNLNKITPIYHARGFFAMPTAITSTKTKPQEVVQFEIWYRKLSTSGNENPILTIADINNNAAQKSQVSLSNIATPKTINGTFSNWIKFKTDARKRVQDPITNEWIWVIDDISDANTPNINQIDIPILPGEKIELKIKSLSEVGWPETPVESDFSNIIEIVFPDDLNNVLNEDQFILKEAQADDIKVKFDRDLEAKGLNLHLNSAIRDADIYYAHKADAIASGFKDANGKIINLYDQLLSMVTKITTLEEVINRSRGVLEVYLVNKGNKTKLFSGNSLTFNINLEDYMTKTKVGLSSAPVDSILRTYLNELMIIDDFSLLIKNATESTNLNLLSNRVYGNPGGAQPATFAYDGKSDDGASTPTINTSEGIQALWLQSDSTILYNTTNASTVDYAINPITETQTDNQWIWLQVKDIDGKYIYLSSPQQNKNSFWEGTNASLAATQGASYVHDLLTNPRRNVGVSASDNPIALPATPITNITNSLNWSKNLDPRTDAQIDSVGANGASMGTTIHPIITSFNNITDRSAQYVKTLKSGDTNSITIPIYIYAKPFTGTKDYRIYGGANTTLPFDDTAYRGGSPSGDMPRIDNASTQWMSTPSTIRIPLAFTSEEILKVGDKIIVTGIDQSLSNPTSAFFSPLNGKLVTVVETGINYVTVAFNAFGTAPTSVVAQSNANIIQVHKKHRGNPLNGPELHAYNVYGRIGGNDLRYITNYVEIVSSNSPAPVLHNKKIRFYMEDENNVRPFEVQLNFNIKQYKPTVISFSKPITNQGTTS